MKKTYLAAALWATIYSCFADFYPAECPVSCECTGPTISCNGGVIPHLDNRLTRFAIDNADPPITALTTDITRRLEHLVSLHLTSVGLTSLQPGALGAIQRLETLEITHNNIQNLSSNAFIQCTNLVNLNLENNNIQIIEEETFDAVVALRNLSLAHNAVLTLPSQLPPNLQSLNIEDNRISQVQFTLHELVSLNLCHNRLTSLLPDQIVASKLQDLCLGGPGFKPTETLLSHDKFPVLKSLQIQGANINQMTQKNIVGMAKETLHTLVLDTCILDSQELFNQEKSKLQVLRASNITLESSTRMSVPRKFELSSVLTEFNFSKSPSLAHLFLTSYSPTTLTELKTLLMPNCNIRKFPEHVLLTKAPNVEKLDVSHNPLDCTCSGLSWLQTYVRHGNISLITEENTTCATPDHLKGYLLLTATLCPITLPDLRNTPKPNVQTTQPATPSTRDMPSHSTYSVGNIRSDLTTDSFTEIIPWLSKDGDTVKLGRSGYIPPSNYTPIGNNTTVIARESQRLWWPLILGILGGIILFIIIVTLVIRFYLYRLFRVYGSNSNSHQREPVNMTSIASSHDQLIGKDK